MDRQSTIGILLIVLLVLIWSVFFAPEPKKKPQNSSKDSTITTVETNKKDSVEIPQKTETGVVQNNDSVATGTDSLIIDSLKAVELENKYGKFAKLLLDSTDKTIRVKTGKLDFLLHSKGGFIEPLYLRDFKTYEGGPLPILPPFPKSYFNLILAHEGKFINTSDFYFQGNFDKKEISVNEDSITITLKAPVEEDKYLAFNYTFYKDKYDVKFNIELKNLQQILNNPFYEINQYVDVPRTEKDAKMMRRYTTIFYKYSDDVEEISATSNDPEKETVQGNIYWISMKSQFFNYTIVPEIPFESATLEVIPHDDEEKDYVKKLQYSSQIPIKYDNSGVAKHNYMLYFGPNDYYILSSYGIDLEDIINLGWGPMKWINRYIILPLFKFLEDIVGNYGIIIFILALFIKLIVSPLTFKTYIGQAKMQVANQLPEMKAIEEKYKNDPQQLQLAKFQLHKQLGVNMFSGCLPQFIQLPVLIAMFYFFPASIELRQQPFLWAEDLSTYDSFIKLPFSIPFIGEHISLFTLLMTAVSMIYIYITQKMQGTSANAQMKFMSYVMPLVFFGVFNSYPAALSYYYLLANLITIAQTWIIRKFFINEEEIIKQLRENMKKKKKKKSKFDVLLEQAKKQQRRR